MPAGMARLLGSGERQRGEAYRAKCLALEYALPPSFEGATQFGPAEKSTDQLMAISSSSLAASRLALAMAESHIDCAMMIEPSMSVRIWITAVRGASSAKGSTREATSFRKPAK